MKILHYCARLRLKDGGVVRAVLDVTSALAQSGKSTTLLCTEGEDWPDHQSGVQLMTTGSFDKKPIRFSRERLDSLRACIAEADVLHLHTPWEPANVQLAKLAREEGTPYVISVHGMLDDWVMKTSTLKKRLFLLLGGRTMFKHASVVHCTAHDESRQANRWIPKSVFKVIPLVFDPSSFLHPPPTSDPDKHWKPSQEDVPVILFLSRLHPKKGVERLLEATSMMQSKIKVIIAGSGETDYEKQLLQQCESAGLTGQVEFVGFVKGDRKIALLRLADLFVLPTSQENFGIVFAEAMGCKLPVITTKGVDIWNELEASGGAIIVENSSKSIATAIESLLADPQKLKTMGVQGQSWVKDTFGGDAIINRYVEMYRNAMNA